MYESGLNFGECSGANTQIAETADTSVTVVVPAAQLRCFQVRAVYREGQSPKSATVSGTSLPIAKVDLKSSEVEACIGGSVTIEATGSQFDTIEWFKNDRLIASGTMMITLTDLSLDDDGSLITAKVTNACGSKTAGPAIVTVDPDPNLLGPMHLSGATRSVTGTVIESECAGFYFGCSNTDTATALCFEPFDESLIVECVGPNPCNPSARGKQNSTVSGVRLAATGSTDGTDAGCSCSVVFGDQVNSSSSFSASFTIDRAIGYTVIGSIESSCGGQCFGTSESSWSLTHATNGVVASFSTGPFPGQMGTEEIDLRGMLEPGDYVLTASAGVGASGTSTGKSAFEFVFEVDVQLGDTERRWRG